MLEPTRETVDTKEPKTRKRRKSRIQTEDDPVWRLDKIIFCRKRHADGQLEFLMTWQDKSVSSYVPLTQARYAYTSAVIDYFEKITNINQ